MLSKNIKFYGLSVKYIRMKCNVKYYLSFMVIHNKMLNVYSI